MTFPTPSIDRVTGATHPEVNAHIEQAMRSRVRRIRREGALAIERRLAELDREWDIERCLETGASSLVLLGTWLGLTHNRRWFALPLGVAGFLLQHALQGWCPPLPVFRRLGVRTADEINRERALLLDATPTTAAPPPVPQELP